MSKLRWFGVGVSVGFLLLGLILVIVGKNVHQIPTPVGPIIFFPEEPPREPRLPPQVQMEIKGEVKDIFDNPRKDVVVIIREIEKHTVTDGKGRYHFSNVPDRDYMTLEARCGEERCSRPTEISRDTTVIEEVTINNVKRRSVRINQPLILQNPNIKVKASLCEKVDDHTPVNTFEEENPRIPVDIGTIWCFVRIFGPLGYEKDKKTEITYLWYWNRELVHSYTQDVGFNPTQKGWRTHAFKNLHGRTGTWRLDIEAKYQQLASLFFET